MPSRHSFVPTEAIGGPVFPSCRDTPILLPQSEGRFSPVSDVLNWATLPHVLVIAGQWRVEYRFAVSVALHPVVAEGEQCLLPVCGLDASAIIRIPRSETSWIAQRATTSSPGLPCSRSTNVRSN